MLELEDLKEWYILGLAHLLYFTSFTAAQRLLGCPKLALIRTKPSCFNNFEQRWLVFFEIIWFLLPYSWVIVYCCFFQRKSRTCVVSLSSSVPTLAVSAMSSDVTATTTAVIGATRTIALLRNPAVEPTSLGMATKLE